MAEKTREGAYRMLALPVAEFGGSPNENGLRMGCLPAKSILSPIAGYFAPAITVIYDVKVYNCQRRTSGFERLIDVSEHLSFHLDKRRGLH